MFKKLLLILGSAVVLFGGGCLASLGHLLYDYGPGVKAVLDMLGINLDNLTGGLLRLA